MSSLDLTAHTSLSPIRGGFAPNFVNYKKGCTRLSTVNDKVYELLVQCRWFSPDTPASCTTKTGRHDKAKILLKMALNTKIQIVESNNSFLHTAYRNPVVNQLYSGSAHWKAAFNDFEYNIVRLWRYYWSAFLQLLHYTCISCKVTLTELHTMPNHVLGAMFSVFASSAEDCWFNP